ALGRPFARAVVSDVHGVGRRVARACVAHAVPPSHAGCAGGGAAACESRPCQERAALPLPPADALWRGDRGGRLLRRRVACILLRDKRSPIVMRRTVLPLPPLIS